MKKLSFQILIVVALFAPLIVRAQTPIYGPQSISLPIISAGANSNSLGVVIPVGKQGNTAIELTTTGCTNLVLYLGTSVSGVSYTTNALTLTTTGAGSTVISNYTTPGIGFLRIDRALNTGTINATNTAYYGVKISAP